MSKSKIKQKYNKKFTINDKFFQNSAHVIEERFSSSSSSHHRCIFIYV